MLIRLSSYSLFDTPDPVLNFPGILFSSAVRLQVGIPGKLADPFLDYSFEFVESAFHFIFRAWFHIEYLLCFIARPISHPLPDRVMPLLFCPQAFVSARTRRTGSDSGSSPF